MSRPIEIFEAHRAGLVRHAYRMLGSLADAEDVAQDAFLRWQGADVAAVRDPAAFLATIVTRLCLDEIASARRSRELYVGAWLPEPVPETDAPDPLEARQEVDLALMMLLQRLSPLERAAFLLHDVFDLDFEAIGAALGRTAAACRQLAARGRTHAGSANASRSIDRAQEAAVARAFHAASASGDVDALTRLLARDVTLTMDGGGKVLATINVVAGADRVSRFYRGLASKGVGRPPPPMVPARLNGRAGFVARDRLGLPQAVMLDIAGGAIVAIYVVRNPDKLGRLTALLPE